MEYFVLALEGLRQWLRGGTLPGWGAPALLCAGVVIGWMAKGVWERECEAEELEEWLSEMVGKEKALGEAATSDQGQGQNNKESIP